MTLRARVASFVLLGSLALAISSARADDIEPPPTDCPAGSEGRSTRGGRWCEASTCVDDAACGASGAHCSASPVPLCVRDEHVEGVARDGVFPGRPTEDHHRALGACAEDGTCSAGTCERERRCLAPGQVPTPATAPDAGAGGWCSVGAAPRRSPGSWLVLLGALIAARATRRGCARARIAARLGA